MMHVTYKQLSQCACSLNLKWTICTAICKDIRLRPNFGCTNCGADVVAGMNIISATMSALIVEPPAKRLKVNGNRSSALKILNMTAADWPETPTIINDFDAHINTAMLEGEYVEMLQWWREHEHVYPKTSITQVFEHTCYLHLIRVAIFSKQQAYYQNEFKLAARKGFHSCFFLKKEQPSAGQVVIEKSKQYQGIRASRLREERI